MRRLSYKTFDKKYTDLSLKKSIRKLIIKEGIRLDGRKQMKLDQYGVK